MSQQVGFAFHVHHDVLFEWCTNYDDRVSYIKSNKPKSEQELRLKLFKMFPVERLPVPIAVAGAAYEVARAAREEARKTYDEARAACAVAWKTYDEAWETYAVARKTYEEAWAAYEVARAARDEARAAREEARAANEVARAAREEARAAYEVAWKTYEPEIIKLHAELCPDCPWDGETIFPVEVVNNATS